MSRKITGTPLEGCRILIVEDEWAIAEDLAQTLEDVGARIVGPFANTVDALENLSHLGAVDAAIIDIGLGDDTSYPLAEALKTTAVPFMFLTGVRKDRLPEQFSRVPHMLKPFSTPGLVDMLLNLCSPSASGVIAGASLVR